MVTLQPAMTLLRGYLGPRRRSLVLLGLLVAAGVGLQLALPQLLSRFLDAALAGASDQQLTTLAVSFLVLGVLQRVCGLGSVYASERLSWDATNALRLDLARLVLRLGPAFHKTHPPGELIERVDGDVTALGEFLSRFAVQLLANIALVVGAVLLVARDDWRAGLALALYALLVVAALAAVQPRGARQWEAARQADAEVFGFLEERLGGTEDLRASGAEAYTLHGFRERLQTMLVTSRRAELTGALTWATNRGLYVLGYALGLALGAALYSSGAISVGGAFAIVAYVALLAGPLESIREQAQDLQSASAAAARIAALQAEAPLPPATAGAPLPAGPLGVQLEAVDFAYDATPVLRAVSLTLAPGRVLGLLGRTGSGKTTLARLLVRRYDPQQGSVMLAGSDLRGLAESALRSRTALVTQDVQILAGSLRDNLALFEETIDDERLRVALTSLGLLPWLETLPDGLDTLLGPGGRGLSAGEAQLVALARVFLRDPGLVVLDEASARLDPATEQLLERALDGLLRGRTAVVIAHRLETLRRADDILVLERGQVVEHGPRLALAADPQSRFAGLLRAGSGDLLEG